MEEAGLVFLPAGTPSLTWGLLFSSTKGPSESCHLSVFSIEESWGGTRNTHHQIPKVKAPQSLA